MFDRDGDDFYRLRDFLLESNRIEGIEGTNDREIDAAKAFLEKPRIEIADLVAFVAVCQPDAVLRSRKDIPGVRVGRHVAPPSGRKVAVDLRGILYAAFTYSAGAPPHFPPNWHPYHIHLAYETLHPFTDGNGRSGRMLWLWQMLRLKGEMPPLGFLHTIYYQSLAASR